MQSYPRTYYCPPLSGMNCVVLIDTVYRWRCHVSWHAPIEVEGLLWREQTRRRLLLNTLSLCGRSNHCCSVYHASCDSTALAWSPYRTQQCKVVRVDALLCMLYRAGTEGGYVYIVYTLVLCVKHIKCKSSLYILTTDY
jgi:hypothetical protein